MSISHERIIISELNTKGVLLTPCHQETSGIRMQCKPFITFIYRRYESARDLSESNSNCSNLVLMRTSLQSRKHGAIDPRLVVIHHLGSGLLTHFLHTTSVKYHPRSVNSIHIDTLQTREIPQLLIVHTTSQSHAQISHTLTAQNCFKRALSSKLLSPTSDTNTFSETFKNIFIHRILQLLLNLLGLLLYS